eukprot:TRINITY_DN6932_c0_g1_i1.p1 TRINITY_DN6932_c0_g1~~TRINITY_DN6932_c0_g1_i1.p1  ORF type:complete len:171 (+),score=44.88 TRINITY_DN6932_c0_g1_i1:340-852(+)
MENQPPVSGPENSDPQQLDSEQHQTVATVSVPTPAVPFLPPEFMMPQPPYEMGHAMVRTAYPYADPYFPGLVAAYGPPPMIHPQLIGVPQPGVPLPSDAVEEPVFVNAKQYHGILRRRQSRAKAESENKLIKCRKMQRKSCNMLHPLVNDGGFKRKRNCLGIVPHSKQLN